MSMWSLRITAPLAGENKTLQIILRILRLACVYLVISLGGALTVLLVRELTSRAGKPGLTFFGIWLTIGAAFVIGSLKWLQALTVTFSRQGGRYYVLRWRAVLVTIGVYGLITSVGWLRATSTWVPGISTIFDPFDHLFFLLIACGLALVFGGAPEAVQRILIALGVIQEEEPGRETEKPRQGA
jgi:hypothetical protein